MTEIEKLGLVVMFMGGVLIVLAAIPEPDEPPTVGAVVKHGVSLIVFVLGVLWFAGLLPPA